MPIGIPGWPLLAVSTASIASARIAFAMHRASVIGCDNTAACRASAAAFPPFSAEPAMPSAFPSLNAACIMPPAPPPATQRSATPCPP